MTPANPITARKKWIAGSLEPKGTLNTGDVKNERTVDTLERL